MKQIILGLIVVSVLISCIEDVGILTPDEQYALELEQYEGDLVKIDEYLIENNLTAEIDTLSGIRYIIIEQGDGDAPVDSDIIVINYEGRYLSDEIFDQGDTVTFTLNTLIAGWRVGLPLLNEGGNMTLFIPSVFGYGTAGRGGIPPSTVLIFDLELIEIQ